MRFTEETDFEWKSGHKMGRFLHVGDSPDTSVNVALI